MSGWRETLISAQSDGPQLLNTVTQASILPAQAQYVLPANHGRYIGQQYLLTASGKVSCVVTTPGTLLFQVLFGATAVYNNAAAAMNLNIVAKTDVSWWLVVLMTIRSMTFSGTAATATLMGQGYWTSEAVVGSPLPTAGGSGTLLVPASAAAVSPTYDPTASQKVDLQAKFSVATATTALTLQQYSLETLQSGI